MTRINSRLFTGSLLSIFILLAGGVCLAGCNERATPTTSGDTHEDHDNHSGHDHGQNEHEGHDHGQGAKNEDGHEGHDDHGAALQIGPAEQREVGIYLASAGPATLTSNISLPGELLLNPDNVAHVVPRVPGFTHSVFKRVGDVVDEGDLLAVLDSREFAQAKAHFLAVAARQRIAESNFDREQKLWKEQISSERVFLDAKQDLDEVKIALLVAERELHALGLTEEDVAALPILPDVEYTRYQLTAPISGTIIERHLVRGEVIKEDADEPTFVIADLSSVWVHLTVNTTHLDHIRPGQKVTIVVPNNPTPIAAAVDYVAPLIDEATRTATARVVLPNPERTLRPGLFVTATLASDSVTVPIAVPKSAIQIIEGQPTVFIHDKKGFMPAAVSLGASNRTHTEILSGLEVGASYVARGGFVLKSEMQKSELEHAGHAH